MTIEELRRKRAEINAQIQALAAKEAGADAELSADELTQFEALSTQFEQLSQQINRQEAAERMNAQHAKPIEGAPGIKVHKEAKQYKGANFARTAMAIAASKGNLEGAARFASDTIGDSDLAMAIETSAGSGGALIPQNTADEVIELLRDRTVVRKLGARTVPLPNGNMSLPRQTGGATASYTGEGTDATASEATTDDIQLSAKTLITLVPISNQLIGRAGFNVEQMVLTDSLNAIGVREDQAFLRGDGASNTPTGIKKLATDAGRTVAWSGSADLATIDAYLDSLILKLMTANSMMISCGWGMSPRTFMKLFGLRDGNGNKVYPEMAQGVLKGYPIAHTNGIPANLGAGTNESEIYFADFNDAVIAEDGIYRIDFSTEATYKDGNGDLQSAFSKNQSLIRIVTEHDFASRHPEGLVLGTGVTW
ncbi:phage major capsid protein [Shewanella sp. KCT]|uniref:phage major capsid protein n=1 Tax=Shewanella sp. KCT TaxID=2569535 RepID=UPI0011826901|nr:phage major capsid protein [Shewanella sp. KCT]TVP11798.1 capsid protein [Shewanella sp. KCT]